MRLTFQIKRQDSGCIGVDDGIGNYDYNNLNDRDNFCPDLGVRCSQQNLLHVNVCVCNQDEGLRGEACVCLFGGFFWWGGGV